MRFFITVSWLVKLDQYAQGGRRRVGFGFTHSGQHVMAIFGPPGLCRRRQVEKHPLIDFVGRHESFEYFLVVPPDIQPVTFAHQGQIRIDHAQQTFGVFGCDLDANAAIAVLHRFVHPRDQ